MNTKKVWLWSLILGMMVAVVAYFTFLPQQSVSTAPSVEASEDEKTKAESEAAEEKVDSGNFSRELVNPMVEVGEGKRAVSIFVDLVPGVSGYIQPKSMVDVIAYENKVDTEAKKEFKSAVLVLENVKVLASGTSANTEGEALQYQTVTLEVTPEEGVLLGLASKGEDGFYLMLRNNEDTSTGKKGFKETKEVVRVGER